MLVLAAHGGRSWVIFQIGSMGWAFRFWVVFCGLFLMVLRSMVVVGSIGEKVVVFGFFSWVAVVLLVGLLCTIRCTQWWLGLILGLSVMMVLPF